MPPTAQTFTSADVVKIVRTELAKRMHGGQFKKTVLFTFSADRPLGKGQVSQPGQRSQDGAPPKMEYPQAVRPGANGPTPDNYGAGKVSLATKFAVPETYQCPPAAELGPDGKLDEGEREEMMARLAELDPGLDATQFGCMSDRTFCAVHHMVHELAGKTPPSTRQHLRAMVGASPGGKALLAARAKQKVAKHDDADDDVMPGPEPRATNFSERRYVSPQPSTMTDARRRQLLAASPAGKIALNRLGA